MKIFLSFLLGLALGDVRGNKFRVKTFRVTSNVQDRYVRTEVAVQVKNNLASKAEYEFGVKLDENEFISSLTMRIGKHNTFYYGNVHEQSTAVQIFNNAVSNGQSAGIVQQIKDPLKDTTFSALMSIPAGEEAFFWLVYEQQLDRIESNYKYKTNIRPYEPVDNLQIKVNIVESRPIKMNRTQVRFDGSDTLKKTVNSDKSVSYLYTQSNAAGQGNTFEDTLYIQYDVERPSLEGGDILVRNGYFVHFISPENLPPIAKNIIFVIDVSGSMSYQSRMTKVHESFRYIMDDLNDDDHFQVISFSSYIRKLYTDWQPVNEVTKADGIAKVNNLRASGMTNINDAMITAVSQTPPNDAANIVIFITDGFPTSGERNWKNIRDSTTARNTNDYAIFTLAIGSSAPYEDMNRLSVMNNGASRQVFDGIETVDQIKGFYDIVRAPLVWNAKLSYNGAKNTIFNSGNLFTGQEMVIIGKLDDPCKAPEPVCNSELLSNKAGLCSVTTSVSVNCDPRPTVPPFDPNDDSRDKMENPKIPLDADIDLEKYYNYLKIQKDLAIYKVTDDENERKDMKDRITQFAVKMQFVTRFTSMVVVEDDNTRHQVGHIKIKKSKEFKNELENLFANKAVEDMVNKEAKRLAKLETENARRRRSAEFSGGQMASSFKWILATFGLMVVLRFRRSIASPVRFFGRH